MAISLWPLFLDQKLCGRAITWLLVMSQKQSAKRVLIQIPDLLLSEVDAIAEAEQRTRSELIREAMRLYIRKQGVYAAVAGPLD